MVTAKLDKTAKSGIHYAWKKARDETEHAKKEFQKRILALEENQTYDRVLKQGMDTMMERPSGQFRMPPGPVSAPSMPASLRGAGGNISIHGGPLPLRGEAGVAYGVAYGSSLV